MPNTQPPPYDELPSSRTLLRSTALAVVVAAVLLVTVILPAEYGWDPTGAGRLLGLAQMGEIKMDLAEEAAATSAAESASATTAETLLAEATGPAQSEHETRVELAPGESVEVKLVMRAGADVDYTWSTDRGTVGFDLHGDGVGVEGARSYRSGGSAWSDQGTLTADFDGLHGWYWQNASDQPVTLTLRTGGDYLDLIRFG